MYVPAGTAPDLATAQRWVNELTISDSPGDGPAA